MKLVLIRNVLTEESTIGELYVDGIFECFTLEDKTRNIKIDGRTAIPIGIYQVIIDFSKRFQKEMPHLLDVPNFTGIRIHSGNTAEDTNGCILVGTTKSENKILQSKIAFTKLFNKLDEAYQKNEEISIEISNVKR